MATVADQPVTDRPFDYLMGTQRAHGLDRWIFVVTAALYIVVTLVGFIPDSMMKVALVEAGARAPFPPLLHVHAVLMGSFLLLLLSQTVMVATGRQTMHERMGRPLAVLALALLIVGFALAPTMYRQVADAIATAPAEAQAQLAGINTIQENILILQLRVGVLFALFIGFGLAARANEPGFHKRMMMIAPAMALPAAWDRITWIPHTLPASPLSATLWPLVSLAPLFLCDVIRNHRIHRAWWVFAALYIPAAILCEIAWDKPWWHELAKRILGA
jgi:hypothetical protein